MKRMLIVVLACLLPAVAAAHDASSLNIIGFSDDDKLFAYEEYSDKDLDTYAIIHIIDLATGNEVKGAPVISEALANPEDSKDDWRAQLPLKQIRKEAWEKAKPLLDGRFKVPYKPAQLYAAVPVPQDEPGYVSVSGELGLRFYPRLLRSYQDSVEIRLKTYEVEASSELQLYSCLEGGKSHGFKLSLVRYDDGKPTGEPKALKWNSAFGQNEACVSDYKLTHIVGNEAGAFVAIIAYWYPVVEGPHQRYLAVPFRLE